MELVRRTFGNCGLNVHMTTLAGVDNDRIYFIASEITRILGYRDPDGAVRRHVRERHRFRMGDVGFVGGNEPRGNAGVLFRHHPNTTLITEPGVWKLVMRSNAPEAENFQNWVCEDVIPTIRRTGRYELPNNPYEIIRPIEMGSVENLVGEERKRFHDKCVKMADASKNPRNAELGRLGGLAAAENRRQKDARLEFLEAEVARLRSQISSHEDRIQDLETEVALLRAMED